MSELNSSFLRVHSDNFFSIQRESPKSNESRWFHPQGMTNPQPSLSLENSIHWFLFSIASKRSLLEVLFGQKTHIILCKQVVWKVLSLLSPFAVILQHSASYNRYDVAFVYPVLGCVAVGIGFPHRLQPCEGRSCFPQACCNVFFRPTTDAYHATKVNVGELIHIVQWLVVDEDQLLGCFVGHDLNSLAFRPTASANLLILTLFCCKWDPVCDI